MCDCEKIPKTDNYVIAWRCWVEVDFEIKEFNSVDNKWCDIPDDGFQAMRLWYNDGNGRYISGSDFYFFQMHPKGIIFGQSNDLDIRERYPGALIKRGKHLPDLLMQKVNNLMFNSEIPI